MTKIDIISGFLGAGKTTLIKKLLAEAYAGEKLVLIENEFGEISIDGGFLKESGVQVSEMSSGCICCSLVGDFGEALKEVYEQFHPDRILIEPSGVGKLSDVIVAVEDTVKDVPEMALNSFVTVADAAKVKVYMKNFGEFYNNQIESAGTIILSRTQKLSQEKLEAAVALLREKNAEAAIITTPWDQIDGKAILAAVEKVSLADELLEAMRREHEEHEHHHHHDHEEHECCCGHHHEEHHHHHEHGDHCCGHHHGDEGCHEHHHGEEPEHCGYHHEEHHHDHGEHCCCGHHHEEHHHHDHDEHCGCGHHHEEHHHEHGEHCSCGHDHHHHHADEVFTSWGRETHLKFQRSAVEDALKELDSGKYGMVLRAKGILPCTDGNWIHFDMVPEEIDVRTGKADIHGKLCVIGSKLDEAGIAKLFGV